MYGNPLEIVLLSSNPPVIHIERVARDVDYWVDYSSNLCENREQIEREARDLLKI